MRAPRKATPIHLAAMRRIRERARSFAYQNAAIHAARSE